MVSLRFGPWIGPRRVYATHMTRHRVFKSLAIVVAVVLIPVLAPLAAYLIWAQVKADREDLRPNLDRPDDDDGEG